jgi:SAM-dependent methyltransferase
MNFLYHQKKEKSIFLEIIVDYNTPTMDTVDWDKRYREGFYNGATEPHSLLQRFWHTIPSGNVVDIAMGSGRNAIFLAAKGYAVCGLDRSSEALRIAKEGMAERSQNISLILGDAGGLPFKAGSFSGIIVFYFLLRDIMEEITGLLRGGGVLVYETFLKRQNAVDRHRNPDFLLEDGELFSYFKKFETLYYEETILDVEGKKRATARFVGRKI